MLIASSVRRQVTSRHCQTRSYNSPADTPYTGGSSTFTLSGGPTSLPSITTTTGAFSFAPVESGTYTVAYSGLPSGYSMTYPLTGPPPSFLVTVGTPGKTGCSVGNAHDATCDVSGSISGIDFGITNETSWIQGICSDIRMDSGYSQVIPASATCHGTSAPYAIIPNPAWPPFPPSPIPGEGPGILFSGSTDPVYGGGVRPLRERLAGGQ